MLTLLNSDNYEIARNLFPNNYPNLAFVYGTIEHTIKGKIWVDNVNNPQSALVICGFYMFLSGKITKEVFDDCYLIITEQIKLLAKMSNNVKNHLSLVCPETMMISPVNFVALDFVPSIRTEYRHNPTYISEDNGSDNDYEITPIDKQNIVKCLWHRFISDIVGDENINNHIGFMIWDKKLHNLVSEAYGIVGGNIMEISTVTHPAYIRKGFSTKVCSHLIMTATKRGLHPIWSCAKNNEASNKTAQRLGMEPIQDYVFYNIGIK